MCAEGSKLVLLATGLCPTNCFYCPISFEKGGKDRIFADEWELESEKDTEKLIQEAENIEATGAGITGGDPLVVWKRVEKYILLLKDTFGTDFHIHLYTSALKNAEHIPSLIHAGLDEIRFHPQPRYWDSMDKNPIKNAIQKTLNTEIDVAIEIPVLPDMEKQILSLIKWANNMGINWINLNELEFSERNHQALENRGYTTKNDISAAVKGSEELAIKILKNISEMNIDMGIHYCSVSFKDGIQLRNRILRRAKNTAKKYDVITNDGTLIKGVIYTSDTSPSALQQLLTALKKKYNIPDKLIYLDSEKNRIETGAWILEQISQDLRKNGYKCYMVEEYPTADRLEVEKIPLPL